MFFFIEKISPDKNQGQTSNVKPPSSYLTGKAYHKNPFKLHHK